MKIKAKQLPAAFSTENQEDCIFKRVLSASNEQKLLAGRQKFAFAFTTCTYARVKNLGLSVNASHVKQQQCCLVLPQYESEMKNWKNGSVGCSLCRYQVEKHFFNFNTFCLSQIYRPKGQKNASSSYFVELVLVLNINKFLNTKIFITT